MDWLRRLYRKKQQKNEPTESVKKDAEFVDIVEGERKGEDEVGGLKDLIRSEAGVEKQDDDAVEVVCNAAMTSEVATARTDTSQFYNERPDVTAAPPKFPRTSRKKQQHDPKSSQIISSTNTNKNIIHQPR